MLPQRPRPSSLLWRPDPLIGFEVADLHDGGSHIGCVLASVGTTKSAGTTFPEIEGRTAFQGWLATGEGVDNPTGDVGIFAIDPDGAGLVRCVRKGEPSGRRELRLVKEKP